MGNPFTESLIRQIKNDSIVRFVSYWDRLEALVIRDVCRMRVSNPRRASLTALEVGNAFAIGRVEQCDGSAPGDLGMELSSFESSKI